jgi:hypothetical protein
MDASLLTSIKQVSYDTTLPLTHVPKRRKTLFLQQNLKYIVIPSTLVKILLDVSKKLSNVCLFSQGLFTENLLAEKDLAINIYDLICALILI